MYTFYWYPKCSTCKKAKVWLDQHDVKYDSADMVANPPTAEVLKKWMENSELPVRRFFNTSGMKYRELGLKDKVADFSVTEASELLSSDGMLIKRPLLVKGDKVLAVGFRESDYERTAE